MSKEQSTQKKKNGKKYIVIVLTMAILVFLLLPLMDNSAEMDNANVSAKRKAIPQIFTSNPLTKLVRQVYNMLAGKNKRQNGVVVARTEDGTLIEMDVTRAAAQQLASEEVDSVSRASYASNGYIQNEDGEWVLVQQIVPESSQRGLHEVNASDTAYDRLVRGERQAKWTGQVAKPEIPQSRWARLWQPIKNFFTRQKDGETVVASAKTPGSRDVGPFGSKGRSSADKRVDRNPSVDYAKAGNIDWDGPSISLGSDVDSTASNALKALLKDPKRVIRDAYREIDDFAKKSLTKEDYQNWKAQADARQKAREARAEARLSNMISKQAEGKTQMENLLDKFLLPTDTESTISTKECNGNQVNATTSAFHAPNHNAEYCTSTGDERYESYERDHNTTEQTRGKLLNWINIGREEFHQDPIAETDRIPALVVMGVYEAGINPFTSNTQKDDPAPKDNQTQNLSEEEQKELQNKQDSKKYLEKYLEWSYKDEGCDKQPCALVASSVYPKYDLKDALETGMIAPVYLDQPDGKFNKVNQFLEQLVYSDDPEDQDLLANPNIRIYDYIPAYSLVSVEKVKQMLQDKKEKDDNHSTLILTETFAEADAAQKYGLASPLDIVVLDFKYEVRRPGDSEQNSEEDDSEEDIYDDQDTSNHISLEAGQTPQQSGMQAGQVVWSFLGMRDQNTRNMLKNMSKEELLEITKRAAARQTAELQNVNPKDLERQVGLDKERK